MVGKQDFFTAINRGPLYGYQYLTIVPGRNFQHLKQYYDINLELDAYGKVRPTEANQKEFRKNEFLIALSGTYIEYGYSRKSNVMLIMKEEDASMADYSICEIDYDKISRLREIYSRYGAPDGDGYILIEIWESTSRASAGN